MTWQTKLAEYLIAFALLGGAYWWIGYSAVEDYKDAQQIVQMKADMEQQVKYDTLAGEYEVLKNKRAANAITIKKETERVINNQPIVYTSSCWTDDGLRNANAAIRGDSGKSAPEVRPNPRD